MSPDGDDEYGTFLLEDAILHGNMTGEMAVLYAYGIYLSNGGTPEGF